MDAARFKDAFDGIDDFGNHGHIPIQLFIGKRCGNIESAIVNGIQMLAKAGFFLVGDKMTSFEKHVLYRALAPVGEQWSGDGGVVSGQWSEDGGVNSGQKNEGVVSGQWSAVCNTLLITEH